MSDFRVGEVLVVKKTKEKVRVVEVRQSDIAIAGRHIDYRCESLTAGKGIKAFSPSELTRN